MPRFPIFLLIFSAMAALLVWVVRSRGVDGLLVAATVLAAICIVMGSSLVMGDTPERLMPGACLLSGGSVTLSVCAVALTIRPGPNGKS